ncbi:MAG: hypothetical protein KKB50_15135 [Planctomycetes bacterium]|nr:hypothetical protein [Planctomycetota bacterium]
MASDTKACSLANCHSRVCWAASRLVLADANEVPPGCPNRVRLADPAMRLVPSLGGSELYITPAAAQAVAAHSFTEALPPFYKLVESGRLTLLELQAAHAYEAPAVAARVDVPETDSVAEDEFGAAAAISTSWIEVELVDSAGHPMIAEEYRITLPDGSVRTGELAEDGRVRFDEMLAGDCTIAFPGLGVTEARATQTAEVTDHA